ncbi:hypothetical protein HD554DRAFT_2166810 [Boletus coccyginus]|nr:hypothetical protein HD554DRAFT_2166810 [Boletus coccyginus]
MASEQHNHCIQPLNGNNYTTWSKEMKALLRSKGLWHLDKAAGEPMLNLMPDQRVHIRASQDDPTATWKALVTLFVQQKASTCVVAYEEFFSIRKRSDESLPALSARVEFAMARIQELHLTSFDLKTSDAELSCMAIIHRQRRRDWWKLSPAQLVDDLDDSDNEEADTAQAECLAVSSVHPRFFADAMHRNDALEWKAAALAELDAHKTNGTWILVPCPKNQPVIGSRWIFTQKYRADGSFEYYKGRLVA